MAEWPEPETDPEEKRRRWGAVALAGAVSAGAILLANGGGASGSWFPAFDLPELQLPTFEMPDVSVPDLRGRSASGLNNASPASADAMSIMAGERTIGAPLSRPASLEDCMRTINDASQTFGPPALIEDTQARHVARFKLTDGHITVTCAEETITLERGG